MKYPIEWRKLLKHLLHTTHLINATNQTGVRKPNEISIAVLHFTNIQMFANLKLTGIFSMQYYKSIRNLIGIFQIKRRARTRGMLMLIVH